MKEAGYVGDKVEEGRNDEGGIKYALFPAAKFEYCLTINEYGFIKEKKTTKGIDYFARSMEKRNFCFTS